jgi:flagellar hook-length control protein FliK
MTNLTPYRFLRICWLGGSAHAGNEEPASADASLEPAPAEQGRRAKEARVLRDSKEEYFAQEKNLSSASAASLRPDSRERTADVSGDRMPDFVFGVLRAQAVVPGPAQETSPRREDEQSRFHPNSSCTDAGTLTEASADPDSAMHKSSERSASTASRAAPSLTRVSAHLFTSYAHKARR